MGFSIVVVELSYNIAPLNPRKRKVYQMISLYRERASEAHVEVLFIGNTAVAVKQGQRS